MDYTDIYLINDVLMLTDVFETFKETCMKYLDPSYTAPELVWGIKLQTIKDYDMF